MKIKLLLLLCVIFSIIGMITYNNDNFVYNDICISNITSCGKLLPWEFMPISTLNKTYADSLYMNINNKSNYRWYINESNYEYAKLNGEIIEIWCKHNNSDEFLVEDYPI